MANILKGEVDLPLADGRTLTLVFDMGALIEAETALGQPMQQLVKMASKGFFGATRALLFGALRARHPEITIEDVNDILAENSEEIAVAVTAALDEAMPDAPRGSEGKAPAGKPRRGATSGNSGAKPALTRKRSSASRRATT